MFSGAIPNGSGAIDSFTTTIIENSVVSFLLSFCKSATRVLPEDANTDHVHEMTEEASALKHGRVYDLLWPRPIC